MTMGRPTTYTEEIGDKICEQIAQGHGLREICRDMEDMPPRQTVLDWLNYDDEPFKSFRAKYMRAREAQADYLAEEIKEIADDGTNDWMEVEVKKGFKQILLDREHVERSKIRITTRQWIAAKLAPKKYSEKLLQELSGPNGGPISVEEVTDARTRLLSPTIQAIAPPRTNSET